MKKFLNRLFSFPAIVFLSSIFYQPTIEAATHYFSVSKNHSIAYTDQGQGTPLILIHAFPTDKSLWQAQQALTNKFRVITLDLWGFGQTDSTDGTAITMSAYADEVKQLMDYLQIKTAIIGGESMGGYITLAFMQKYPSNVSGLILADTQAIADTQEMKSKREASALDVLQNGTDNLINNFMPKALSVTATAETKTYLKQILIKQSPTAIASALRGMALRIDTSDALAASSLPILIITGSDDSLISPEQSSNMHKLAKNSKLVVIPNAGHLANLEKPTEWNQAVINMFN